MYLFRSANITHILITGAFSYKKHGQIGAFSYKKYGQIGAFSFVGVLEKKKAHKLKQLLKPPNSYSDAL